MSIKRYECGHAACCPHCGREETEDKPFERIRRITGYLVGTTDRFNDGKAAEEKERIKHSCVNLDNKIRELSEDDKQKLKEIEEYLQGEQE